MARTGKSDVAIIMGSQSDWPIMTNAADTLAEVVDAITDAVLMRSLSTSDRGIILDWLKEEYGVTENEVLPATVPEQVSALVAAVLISSVYFHLR